MEKPRLAYFLRQCPAEDQVGNDVGHQCPETSVGQVFGWQEHCQCALDEELAVGRLVLLLLLFCQGRVESWVWIQGVIDLTWAFPVL